MFCQQHRAARAARVDGWLLPGWPEVSVPRDGEAGRCVARNGHHVAGDGHEPAAVVPVQPGRRAVGRVHANRLAGSRAVGPDLLERRAKHGVTRVELAAEGEGQVPRAHVAGIGYFAVGTIRDPALLRWTAYSANGKDLGGGLGIPEATTANPSH